MLKKFSSLGDPTLLLLGAFGVFFYLWTDDDRRKAAVPWGLTIGLCVALTIASKLTLYLFGWNHLHSMRLHSPSGHVAVATTFYGGCTMILATGHTRAVRFSAWMAASLLVAMLAASRVMLGLHSIPEIMVGIGIGIACLLVFNASLAKRSIPPNAGQLIALVLLIIVVRTSRVDGEALVSHMAHEVQAAIEETPAAGAQLVRSRMDEILEVWRGRSSLPNAP